MKTKMQSTLVMALICLFALAFSQTTAAEEGQEGNGGFGLELNGRIEILDLYEAREVYKLTVSLGAPNDPYEAKIKIMLDRLAKWMPVTAAKYQKMADQFFTEHGDFFDGRVVIVSNKKALSEGQQPKFDIGNTIIDARYNIVAMARNLSAVNSPNDQPYAYIYNDAWARAVDNNSRAALVLHELFYMFSENLKNSQYVRKLVAHLASAEFDNLPYREVYFLINPGDRYSSSNGEYEFGDPRHNGANILRPEYKGFVWDIEGNNRYSHVSFNLASGLPKSISNLQSRTAAQLHLRQQGVTYTFVANNDVYGHGYVSFNKEGEPQEGVIQIPTKKNGDGKIVFSDTVLPLANQRIILKTSLLPTNTDCQIYIDVNNDEPKQYIHQNAIQNCPVEALLIRPDNLVWSFAELSSDGNYYTTKGVSKSFCEIAGGPCLYKGEWGELMWQPDFTFKSGSVLLSKPLQLPKFATGWTTVKVNAGQKSGQPFSSYALIFESPAYLQSVSALVQPSPELARYYGYREVSRQAQRADTEKIFEKSIFEISRVYTQPGSTRTCVWLSAKTLEIPSYHFYPEFQIEFLNGQKHKLSGNYNRRALEITIDEAGRPLKEGCHLVDKE